MSRYAINRTIFSEKDGLWFGIYNSNAIEHMRLSDMQLTGFVCNKNIIGTLPLSNIQLKVVIIVPNF